MKKTLTVVAAALAVALMTGIGVAWASIPDSSGVIHGCFKTPVPAHGTNLQVIDTGAGGTCASGYLPLTWNQTGPQGPAGPQGPQGSPGLSGINVVASPSITDSNPHETDCPSGQAALSVVFNQVNAGVFDQTISAQPVLNGSGQPIGYSYQSSNTTVYRANVTCATVAS